MTKLNTPVSDALRPFRFGLIGALSVGLLMLGNVYAFARTEPAKSNPELLQDLTSMVGKVAPAFALQDSEGRTFDVKPGDGRNYVIVFHMGSV